MNARICSNDSDREEAQEEPDDTHISSVADSTKRETEGERERARDTGELKKKRWEFKTAEDSSPSLSIGSRLLSEAPAAP